MSHREDLLVTRALTLRNGRRRVAGCKHAEDMLDGQAMATDDGLSPEEHRVYRDPVQELTLAQIAASA
jgi:hypothetical protein